MARRHTRKHKPRRSQHGGNQCGAYPRQSGGMAPFAAGEAYLLDAATRVQAEVGPLDKAFAELPSVIPHSQAGGRRHRSRRHRSRRHRSHKGKSTRKHSRRVSRRRVSSRRYQRGGALAPFAGSYTLVDHHAMTPKMLAQNPQFATESTVNAEYSQFAGAQHA